MKELFYKIVNSLKSFAIIAKKAPLNMFEKFINMYFKEACFHDKITVSKYFMSNFLHRKVTVLKRVASLKKEVVQKCLSRNLTRFSRKVNFAVSFLKKLQSLHVGKNNLSFKCF